MRATEAAAMNGRTLLGCILVTGWLSLVQALVALAEPYRPAHDAQILERLPLKGADPAGQEIRALRNNFSKDPRNLELAVKIATRYIERVRAEGDPRYLGQAQAVLASWWNEPETPTAVLLLRATIRQNAHEFDAALADLDEVIRRQPTNAQAWLTEASILQVQARYEEARRACRPLTRLAASHVALACLSDIAGLTGQAATAQEQLRGVLARSTVADRERIWILTMLAEMATRTGDARAAEHYFAEALKTGVKDLYLLGAYADFLLDQGRYQDVVVLLQQETKADGLLLRLALAEQALDRPSFRDHVAALSARFAASRARGTGAHVREEARFTLTLLHDPQGALQLARTNWTVQREPADARVLLESALAAGNRDAAKPALDWLHANHVEDLRLRQLAERFRESVP